MSSFGGTVKLTGESEYKKALSEISSNLKVLNSEMKAVTSEYDKNDKSVSNLSAQNDVLNKKIDEQKSKVDILTEALEKSKKETGDNSATTQKWQIELNNAQADLNKLNRELDTNAEELKTARKEAADLEEASKKVERGFSGFTKAVLECGSGSRTLGEVFKGTLSNGLEDLNNGLGDVSGKTKSFLGGIKELNSNTKEMGVVAALSVAALKLFKDEMDETGDEVKETGEEEEKTGEKTIKLGDLIKANLISDAIKGGLEGLANGIKAIGDGFGQLISLGTETKETQVSMAKLEASFNSAGLEADYATDTVYSLYGVLGDTDRAVEASNLLAKMSKDETDLEANSRILTGVFAEFGDSIPTEGLAEGMQATAKMGSVQGVLADALEWSGVNLDEYNETLEEMNSEEERAAYIQQTLSDIYGESADAYREANQALIENNEAILRNENAMAHLGATTLPISTNLTNIKSTLIMGLTPALDSVFGGVDALTGSFNELLTSVMYGNEGAVENALDSIAMYLDETIDNLEFAIGDISVVVEKFIDAILKLIVDELPYFAERGMEMLSSILSGISGAIGKIFPVVLTVVQTLTTTILQKLPMLIEMGVKMLVSLIQGISSTLPEMIPTVINAVILVTKTLLANLDLVIDAGIELIFALVDGLIEATPELIDQIPFILGRVISAITQNLPKILQAGVSLVVKIGEGLVQAIPQLISKVPQLIIVLANGFKNAWSTVKNIGKDLIKGIWNGIDDATSWILTQIKSFGKNVLNGIKNVFGIHSPSTVFKEEVGKNLALGVGEGFSDTMADVSAEMQSAIPTEFDASVTTNMSGGQVSTYDMMVVAFKKALSEVKVVLDEREMGGFVTNTVERQVFA